MKVLKHLKRVSKSRLDVWLCLLLTFRLISIALPDGLGTRIGKIGLPLGASSSQIRNAWGPGDAGSLLEAALTWSKLSNLDEVTQYWIVRLWSPGLSIIEVPMIWLEKLFGIPIFVSLLVLSLLLWSYLIFICLKSLILTRAKVLFWFAFLAYSFSYDFTYLFYEGLFYTETIFLGLLLIGLLKANSLIIRRDKYTFYSFISPSLFIGLATWVRHVIDFALALGLIVGYLIIKSNPINDFFISTKNRLFQKDKKSTSQLIDQRIQIGRIVFFTMVLAFLITLPWRLIGHQVYGGKPLAMSSAFTTLGPGLWVDSKKEPDFFWEPYGMNWACKIDPVKCSQVNSDLSSFTNRKLVIEAVASAINNPLEYIKIRTGTFASQWTLVTQNLTFDVLLNWFLLLMPLSWIFLLARYRTIETLGVCLIWGCFVATLMGQLLIIHYESRYFIPIKFMYFIFTFISIPQLRSYIPKISNTHSS